MTQKRKYRNERKDSFSHQLTDMAKDTETSWSLPRWPQKMVLTKPTAKDMNWAIVWGEETRKNQL